MAEVRMCSSANENLLTEGRCALEITNISLLGTGRACPQVIHNVTQLTRGKFPIWVVAGDHSQHFLSSQRNWWVHHPTFHPSNLTSWLLVNIHSHLLGSLLFCLLPLCAMPHTYPRTAGLADMLVFAAFFYGVAVCFFLSATYASRSHDQAAFC